MNLRASMGYIKFPPKPSKIRLLRKDLSREENYKNLNHRNFRFFGINPFPISPNIFHCFKKNVFFLAKISPLNHPAGANVHDNFDQLFAIGHSRIIILFVSRVVQPPGWVRGKVSRRDKNPSIFFARELLWPFRAEAIFWLCLPSRSTPKSQICEQKFVQNYTKF